ncbi:MAG TPA: class D sortase [Bryobacteraceae bacterium]
MMHTDAPVLVRRIPSGYSSEPGLHSHNRKRRARGPSRSLLVRVALALLVVLGLSGVGYYAYTLGDRYVYQVYENWAFDQQIAGRPGVTFEDYLRERTPFGFLTSKISKPANTPAAKPERPPTAAPPPVEGTLLGRVEISRLGLSAIVKEGVSTHTLSTAVGHIPSTSMPGQNGNFAIAAHRDTLFRALKDIRTGDLVTFQSAAGSYTYQVAATKIVKPADVSVLRADGGGLIPVETGQQGPGKLLTMITCYPFYYVGAAPKRFIVEARLVEPPPPNIVASRSTVEVPMPAAAPSPPAKETPHAVREKRTGGQFQSWPHSRKQHAKKHGFWHRILHLP